MPYQNLFDLAMQRKVENDAENKRIQQQQQFQAQQHQQDRNSLSAYESAELQQRQKDRDELAQRYLDEGVSKGIYEKVAGPPTDQQSPASKIVSPQSTPQASPASAPF